MRNLDLRQPILIVFNIVIGIIAFFITSPVFAEPYDPQLCSKIDNYLEGRGSPIGGNGAVFFSSGVQFDVDPRLIVAIAGQESNFGLALGQPRASCSASSFNAWSWFFGKSHTSRDSNLTSFANGIQRVTSGIRRLYLNQGAQTIQQILDLHYCVSSCGNWVSNITSFYTAQLGDTSDLTFHIGLIDFEQFTTAPTHFTGAQPPLQVFAAINGTVSTKIADSATISGGQVLNLATEEPADPSVVYGTVSASTCSGCPRAITIQFANKVSNFSMFLVDGEPGRVVTYTVQDDQGGMQTITNMAATFNGYTVMLPEAGIRQVTVTSNGGANWDFVIDNIRFSPD